MLFLPFLTTSNIWLVSSTSEYQNDIDTYDVDFIRGYNIFQYLVGIQPCSMLAKELEVVKNAENGIVSHNFSSLVSTSSSSTTNIGQQVRLILNS